jgi:hypothetical protein
LEQQTEHQKHIRSKVEVTRHPIASTSFVTQPILGMSTGFARSEQLIGDATQATLEISTAGGSEQPIASTSHATHPALGMQTDYTPNMKKIKVFKYGENNNGRIIMVSGTIKQLREAVNEKLFKGKIKTENLILIDKDNALICDDDDIDILDNNGIYFAKVLEEQ